MLQENGPKIPEGFRPYLLRAQIESRVAELGTEINRRLNPDQTVVIGVLGGALFFMADLARHLETSYLLDFITLSSYHGGTNSVGKVDLLGDVVSRFEGREAVVIDDIFDTGRTLSFASDHLLKKGCTTVKRCVFLAKEHHRISDECPEFVGFFVPDGFYLGYGLDLGGRYRGLRDIYRKEK